MIDAIHPVSCPNARTQGSPGVPARHRKPGLRIARLFSLILLATAATGVQAHKVNMFAYVEGDEIFIEGYFADGKKAAASDVAVTDASGEVLVSGTTDSEGQLTLPIPARTDLRIVLNAGMGHQTDYTILADELGGEPAGGRNAERHAATAVGDASPETEETRSTVRETPANGDDLEVVVERAVGQAMRPLMRSVSEMRAEKELGAIIGGIGYIFGVLGIYYYIKARRISGK